MPDSTPETAPPGHRPVKSALQSHAAAVYRFLRRRIARPQDADDLAQEVFIRFLRIDSGKLVNKPLAYLYGIAAHVVHEFRMQNEQESEHVVYDSLAADSVAETPAQFDPDEATDRLALQQQLEQALNRLPRMHRAIVLMIKRDGLSHEEVAQLTQLNVRTVERYLMQAMTKLRMMQWDER